MRLQKLYLPDRQVDEERSEERFALVLDDCGAPLTDEELTKARQFATECGADSLWVTTRKVVVDPVDDAPCTNKVVLQHGDGLDSLTKALRELIRVRYNGDDGAALGMGGH